MSITPPENYAYFTVTGRFLSQILDTADPDRYPDVVPATGTFTFTPNAKYYKNTAMPATFLTPTVTGTLDASGYLVDNLGNPGVVLMSSNSPDVSPSGWTWRVTMTVGGQQFAAFDLPANIEPGATVDLTTVMPAATSAGAITIVTEASRLAAEAARDEAVAAAESVTGSVETAVEAYLVANPPGGAVDSVAGKSGVVVLVKGDVGLGNVDNTSDLNKPISTATQTALDGKVPTTRTVAGKALSANVTLAKGDVGLGNVDNTSDAAKPISTATQTALDGKEPTITTLSTAKGGTGLASFSAANRFVTTSSTSALTTTKTAPTGVVVGTTDAQTLTGKTMSGADNTFSNIPQSAVTDLSAALNSGEVKIYSTALNTWPTRTAGLAAQGRSGYTGPVVWRHRVQDGTFAPGVNPTFPATAATEDDTEWTVAE